jgi:hypothetical protein
MRAVAVDPIIIVIDVVVNVVVGGARRRWTMDFRRSLGGVLGGTMLMVAVGALTRACRRWGAATSSRVLGRSAGALNYGGRLGG